MKLTGEQIIKILDEKEDEVEDGGLKSAFGNFGNSLDDEFNSVKLGLGESESVHCDREGSSYDTMVQVIYFKDHDVYISLSGYYSSRDGTEWDGDYKQVYSKTKMITIYEPDSSTFYGPII